MLTFISAPENNQDQTSQEIRLASTGRDWESYVIGAYYFDQDADSSNLTSSDFIIPATRLTQTQVDSENIALFGELNYKLTRNLELIFGARYTEDDLKYRTIASGDGSLIFGPEGDVANNTNESDLSPKVALQWSINDTAMTYVSYTIGYKGPAFDTGDVAAGTVVDPETSDAWEWGLKSSWLDNRLFLNIAVFYSEYTDFQAQALFDPDPDDMLPGSFLLVNAGEVSTQGVEAEFIASVSDNCKLSGDIAYADGKNTHSSSTRSENSPCKYIASYNGQMEYGTLAPAY